MRLDLVFAFVALVLLCVAAAWLSIAKQRRDRGKRSNGGW